MSEQSTKKIKKIFEFLLELNRIKTPPVVTMSHRDWYMSWDQLPSHDCIRKNTEAHNSTFLKVIRPQSTPCPAPSVVIQNWVKPKWQDPRIESSEIKKSSQGTGANGEEFNESEARIEAWENWSNEREIWRETELATAQASEAFNKLYDLYGKIQRESEKYQLFIADGFVKVSTPNGKVDHPLLLQRVNLKFNAAVPEFELTHLNDPPELYLPLLRFLGVPGNEIQRAIETLESNEIHPLEQARTNEFLKELSQRFWKTGEFFENSIIASETQNPHILRNPHFFLGNRNQGFDENVRRFIDSLDHQRRLPESLLRIVGEHVSDTEGTDENQELLLTHHANPEQERVIHQLQEAGSVLVQGPPGTGKSHTIANLIGHLLANEKSILVVSQSSKALRVVREKVAEPLQSLCVSVLQTDEEGNKELEESVSGIVNYLGTTSIKKLESQIEKITEKRNELQLKTNNLEHELKESLAFERFKRETNGTTWTPAEAAKQIANHPEDLLPGSVTQEIPLTSSEISELLRQRENFTVEEETLLAGNLPDTTKLPAPEEFANCFDQMVSAKKQKTNPNSEYWTHSRQTTESLDELITNLKDAIAPFSEKSQWAIEVTESSQVSRQAEQWEELAALIDSTFKEVEDREAAVLKVGPKIKTKRSLDEQLSITRSIVEFLSKGKKWGKIVSLTHPDWNAFQKEIETDKGGPRTLTQFSAVQSMLEIQKKRQDIRNRWVRQTEEFDLPKEADLGKKPEKQLHAYATQIRQYLNWYETIWSQCETQMKEAGLAWDRIFNRFSQKKGAISKVETICSLIDNEVSTLVDERKTFAGNASLDESKQKWIDYLEAFSKKDSAYPLVKELKLAVKTQNYDQYEKTYRRVLDLKENLNDFRRYQQLLEKLKEAAPKFEESLRTRNIPSNNLKEASDLENAWNLTYWNQILKVEHGKKTDRTREQLAATREKLNEVTASYIEKRAWLAQLKRTGLKEQQALSGWLGLHKKIGKGTGRHVGRLKEEAKRTLKLCRNAVPVWIMPLSRVVESFDLATTSFDVVIVDEASQSDVLGLVALALGKKVVVVGDHEQVSPYGVGQSGDEINKLIDELLPEIPNRQLYDGKTSIYDLARQSFGGTIRLIEHFRCVPNIIKFSNDLCYGGEIIPLREHSSSSLYPSTVVVKSEQGEEQNGTNPVEALEIVSLICAISRLEEYKDSTIGVISMVGTEQAIYIDSILRKRLSASEYQRRRILCGNPSQFQGDERDVIFLSLVHSSKERPLRLTQKEETKRSYNVAASRARDQLWVVHSMNPEKDLKTGDLRLRLIRHAEDSPKKKQTKVESPKFESWVEKEVFEFLSAKGFEVKPDYRVGNFPVGMVVKGSDGTRAVLKCVGDCEISENQLEQDLSRQMTLERLGWEFVSFQASQYYLDKQKTLQTIERKIKRLKINPTQGEFNEDSHSLELRDRVIKRAEMIRSRWSEKPEVKSKTKQSRLMDNRTKKAS